MSWHSFLFFPILKHDSIVLNMNHCHLLYFLAIGIIFGCCDGVPTFQLELVTSVSVLEDGQTVDVQGPPFVDDPQKQKELCILAKDFITARFNEPSGPSTLPPTPGMPKYPGESSLNRWVHVKWCGTSPKMWLRARRSSDIFIIMADMNDIVEMSARWYEFSRYTYNLQIFAVDPADRVIKNNVPPGNDVLMRGNSLENFYKFTMTSFMELLYICMRAKQHLEEKFVKKPVSFACSDVGSKFLKLYDYESGKVKEYLAFQCPIKPITYVYFAGPVTEVGVEIIMVRWDDGERVNDEAIPRT